jgi:hypothetical protein
MFAHNHHVGVTTGSRQILDRGQSPNSIERREADYEYGVRSSNLFGRAIQSVEMMSIFTSPANQPRLNGAFSLGFSLGNFRSAAFSRYPSQARTAQVRADSSFNVFSCAESVTKIIRFIT